MPGVEKGDGMRAEQISGNRKKLKNLGMNAAGKACRSMIFILGGSVLGLLALLLAFCLPLEPIRLHVWQSLYLLEEEFGNSEMIPGYPATLTGNFTDCLMLENAVYRNEEHSMLEQVLYMYRGESGQGDGWATGDSLVDYLEGTEQPREVEYPRYWHGYLVVLKPLLAVTTLGSIRIGASALQLGLAGFICLECGAQKRRMLGAAFVLSLPFLYYVTLYTSLSLSICYYIMCAAVLAQLKLHERLEGRGGYWEFFLLVGMVTAYFDFLTYPLVTLGFPLCVFLYLSGEKPRIAFVRAFGLCLAWAVGYGGLWAMKWVLTDLLTGGSVIRDGWNTLFVRTGAAEGQSVLSGFFAVLKQNLSVYGNWGFYLPGVGIGLWLLALYVGRRRAIGRGGLACMAPFILPALLPFVWIFFTQNHSEQHWIYTCKIFAVSAFALIGALGKGIEKISGEADRECRN